MLVLKTTVDLFDNNHWGSYIGNVRRGSRRMVYEKDRCITLFINHIRENVFTGPKDKKDIHVAELPAV